MSNGGMMAFLLVCEMPGVIAAIGVVASGMPENLKNSCKFQKLDVIMIVGTNDPLILFKGGYERFFRRKLGKVISVKELIRLWTKGKNCKSTPVEKLT